MCGVRCETILLTVLKHFVLPVLCQLIDDKKSLSEKCEQLVQELKTVDKKYQEKIKTLEDKSVLTLRRRAEVIINP